MAVLLALVSLGNYAIAKDYYVAPNGNNNNNGSIASPWKTINHAVNFRALKGGDRVLIRQGVYRESVVMTKAGNTNQRIIVKNYPGETPVINGKGLTYDYNWREYTGLFNVRASYVTVDGLKVINANPNANAGNATGICVLGPNVTDVTIRNCVTNNTRSSGIAIWGRTNGSNYSGCRNIIVEHCDISGAINDGYNEHLTIANGVDGFTIRNNKVHDSQYTPRPPNLPIGIDAKVNVRNGRIYGNEVYNLNESNGIYVDAWDSEAYNIHIYNNYIHDVDHTGIPIGAEQGGTAHDIKVYNNLIENVGENGIAIAKSNIDQANSVYNVSIYNNTVVKSGYYAMHVTSRNTPGVEIINNIFSQNNWSNATTVYSDNKKNIQVRNNITDGAQNAWLPGQEVVLGTNNINSSPQFANANAHNYRLKPNSPAIDKGRAVSVSQDADGKPRPIGNGYDIGAYEFGTANQYEDKLTSLQAPGRISPNGRYTIRVRYKTTTQRDVIVLLQRNSAPWTNHGYAKTTVNAREGAVDLNIRINNEIPLAQNAYKWAAYLVPVGGNYNNRLDDLQQIDVDAVGQTTRMASISNDGLRIYPIPAQGRVNIESSTPVSSIVVYNLHGKKVISIDGADSRRLDVSQLLQGTYLLDMKFEDGTTAQRKIMISQ